MSERLTAAKRCWSGVALSCAVVKRCAITELRPHTGVDDLRDARAAGDGGAQKDPVVPLRQRGILVRWFAFFSNGCTFTGERRLVRRQLVRLD